MEVFVTCSTWSRLARGDGQIIESSLPRARGNFDDFFHRQQPDAIIELGLVGVTLPDWHRSNSVERPGSRQDIAIESSSILSTLGWVIGWQNTEVHSQRSQTGERAIYVDTTLALMILKRHSSYPWDEKLVVTSRDAPSVPP